MSDNLSIVIVVAVVIVIVLFMFREQLRRFMFKANKEGIEAKLETRDDSNLRAKGGRQPSVNISGNKQIGKKNRIDVGRNNVNVEKNLQRGEDEEIVVRPDKTNEKKKR